MKKNDKITSELKLFISQKMRMSHIYQPLIIRELLQNNGVATVNHIAKELSGLDSEFISYYEERIKMSCPRILSPENKLVLRG